IYRVSTTATVFLGLTMACAQCHDHKYDPIAQREYYQFFAFLNNDDEPHLEVPRPDVVAERAALGAQIAQIESELEGRFPPYEQELQWAIVRPEKTDGPSETDLSFDERG